MKKLEQKIQSLEELLSQLQDDQAARWQTVLTHAKLGFYKAVRGVAKFGQSAYSVLRRVLKGIALFLKGLGKRTWAAAKQLGGFAEGVTIAAWEVSKAIVASALVGVTGMASAIVATVYATVKAALIMLKEVGKAFFGGLLLPVEETVAEEVDVPTRRRTAAATA